MKIQLADPKAGYLAYQEELDAAIARVLNEGQYILGADVAEFEREFSKLVAGYDVVSTGNGTDAIELVLRAFNIGPGDLVITTSNTAVATVAAIELSGARSLLVDIDERTLTLSPEKLEAALHRVDSHRVKAVIVVHLYGHPAELPAMVEILARHSVILIEDCAQAHGATIIGQPVGTWGAASTFSFYPTKNLGALGDAGAVVTKDSILANRLRELREYGWKDRYISEHPGMNSRLDSLQAAILRVKLRHLEEENSRRLEIARRFEQAFGDLDLMLPATLPGFQHVFHQYVVRTGSREALKQHLHSLGIGCGVLYPVPIHEQPAYRGRVEIASKLKITEQAAETLLCLPVHPWLSDEQVEEVVGGVRSFFRR